MKAKSTAVNTNNTIIKEETIMNKEMAVMNKINTSLIEELDDYIKVEKNRPEFDAVEFDGDYIVLPDINGEKVKIKASLFNMIFVQAANTDGIEYDPVTEKVTIRSIGYTFELSSLEVLVTRPDGKKAGTNSSKGYGSRNYIIANYNSRISLSRLWCLGKAYSLKALSLYELPKWVHNHKANNGNLEALIRGKCGLHISNYELCTYAQNKIHADAWHKAHNLGLNLAFSAYNNAAISVINQYNTKEDIESHLLEFTKDRGLYKVLILD